MIRQKRNVCRAKCLVLSLDVREMERRGRAELPGRRGEGVTGIRADRRTDEVCYQIFKVLPLLFIKI